MCNSYEPYDFYFIFLLYWRVEIFNMQSLWLLDLSHNEVETLPEIYPEQLYLGEIYLNGNRLICVPDNLARLKNIEYLSLTHNNLLYVPAVIFREEAMVKVDHNPFLNHVPMNIKYLPLSFQNYTYLNNNKGLFFFFLCIELKVAVLDGFWKFIGYLI